MKGESRPTQTEAARASVLSSLETVDLVVVFEDDTPERLLQEIKPDVLVKGADYTIETVVGSDFVQSYGGRVVLAEIVPGFSTTATIARMNTSRYTTTLPDNAWMGAGGARNLRASQSETFHPRRHTYHTIRPKTPLTHAVIVGNLPDANR